MFDTLFVRHRSTHFAVKNFRGREFWKREFIEMLRKFTINHWWWKGHRRSVEIDLAKLQKITFTLVVPFRCNRTPLFCGRNRWNDRQQRLSSKEILDKVKVFSRMISVGKQRNKVEISILKKKEKSINIWLCNRF